MFSKLKNLFKGSKGGTLVPVPMMEKVKKKQGLYPTEYKSEIAIRLGNGITHYFSAPAPDRDKVAPYRDFYLWYFGREKSEHYVFKFKNGETMIRRVDISTFTTQLYESRG